MTPERPRAVLLDWDGTLVDSRHTVVAVYRAATTAILGRPFPLTADEQEIALVGHAAATFGRLTPDPDVVLALTRACVERYPEGPPVRPFAGAGALLSALREAGALVGIVTSKERPSYEHDLATLGFGELVDAAITGDLPIPPKPDAAPVLACLRALGVDARDAVLVGDAPTDVAAGRAAGVRTIAAAYGFAGAAVRAAGADAVVHDLEDLAKALRLR